MHVGDSIAWNQLAAGMTLSDFYGLLYFSLVAFLSLINVYTAENHTIYVHPLFLC